MNEDLFNEENSCNFASPFFYNNASCEDIEMLHDVIPQKDLTLAEDLSFIGVAPI